MFVSNLGSHPGYKITEILGMVEGNVVTSKHIGRDIAATLKKIIGGEIRGYTQLLENARDIAKTRMIEKAKELQADAILNVRYSTCSLSYTMAEILAFGTAVKLVKNSMNLVMDPVRPPCRMILLSMSTEAGFMSLIRPLTAFWCILPTDRFFPQLSSHSCNWTISH